MLKTRVEVFAGPVVALPVFTSAEGHPVVVPKVHFIRVAGVGTVHGKYTVTGGDYVVAGEQFSSRPPLADMRHKISRPVTEERRQRRVVLTEGIGEANVELYVPAVCRQQT